MPEETYEDIKAGKLDFKTKPEIPTKPISPSPTPLPSRNETMAENTPDSPPYEVPDTEFSDQSDTAIVDQAPEDYESNSQDISENMEIPKLNSVSYCDICVRVSCME